MAPKKIKYRKHQKGRIKGVAQRGNKLNFGDYGLKALGRGRITAQQIEAARIAITRHVKRRGKIWIRISLTSRSQRSLLRLAWARARAESSTGSLR